MTTQNKNLKITICMPFYNSTEYLKDALDSIAMQTYKNHELLIYDDGSDTQHYNSLQNFLNRYSGKSRVVGGKHIGTLDARITLLNEADGDIVVSLDADDYYTDKEFFKDIVEKFNNEDTDLIMFSFTRSTDTSLHCINYDNDIGDNANSVDYNLRNYFLTSTSLNHFITKAVKKSSLKKLELFNRFIYNTEDRLLGAIAINECTNVSYINKVYYCYRVNENSVTHQDFSIDVINDYVFTENKVADLSCDWNTQNYTFETFVAYSSVFDLAYFNTANGNDYSKCKLIYSILSMSQEAIECVKAALDDKRQYPYKSFVRTFGLWLWFKHHYLLLYIYLRLYNFVLKLVK